MSPHSDLVDGLVQLDARAWSQLVRALRRRTDLPGHVTDTLAKPSGELSSGPARRALCEALADAHDLRGLLLEDSGLPAAVHRALDIVGSARADADADADTAQADPDGGAVARAEGRARVLRRTLEDERRRREGAEARAASAELRAQEVAAERDVALGRITQLEVELARATDARDRHAARAERRSASRAEVLADALAAERSAHAALQREHDLVRAELTAVRAELEEHRARVRPSAPAGQPAATQRPLELPPDLDDGTTVAARWLAGRVGMLIVDGYNAALTLRPGRTLEEQRRWLIERMRPLASRGPATTVVVFDGDRGRGSMRDAGGIEVRFSPSGVTADDEIVFAVVATDAPVLVITDDAELGRRVRAEGGNVAGVVHLLGIVEG